MASHFYKSDGICVEGLREARKCSALPSPTTVLGILKSAGLIRYLEQQILEAAATTPRANNETDADWCSAVRAAAAEHSDAAKKFGGELHDWIQQFNLASLYHKTVPKLGHGMTGQCKEYVDWYDANVKQPLAVEQIVFGDGYAGRLDFVAELHDGRIACLDAKSQALRGKRLFNHYTNWALQLAAYAAAYNKTADNPTTVLISLVASSDEPVRFECYEWSGFVEEYYDLFKSVLHIWKLDNNYFPDESVDAAITKAGL